MERKVYLAAPFLRMYWWYTMAMAAPANGPTQKIFSEERKQRCRWDKETTLKRNFEVVSYNGKETTHAAGWYGLKN